MSYWYVLLWYLQLAFASPENPYNFSTMVDIPDGEEFTIRSKYGQGFMSMPFLAEYNGRVATPVVLSYRNNHTEPHDIDVSCRWNYQQVLSFQHKVGPNEEISKQWMLPMVDCSYCMVSCKIMEDEQRVSGGIDKWVERWDFEVNRWDITPILMLASDASLRLYPEWYLPTKHVFEENKLIRVKEPNTLPFQGTGYLGMGRVIWFAEDMPLTDVQQQALKDWVMLGGHLIVVGEVALDSQPQWKDWTHNRFLAAPKAEDAQTTAMVEATYTQMDSLGVGDVLDQIDARANDRAVNTFKAGLGSLSIVPQTVSTRTTLDLMYGSFYEQNGLYREAYWTKDGPKQIKNEMDSLWETDDQEKWLKDGRFQLLPPAVIVIFSILFFVVLGPINVRIKGSRLHLLWRTPLIGLVGLMLVLITETVLNRGNLLGDSETIVVLDQRSNQLLVLNRRLFLPTTSFQSRLPLAAHTQIFPIRIASSDQTVAMIDESEATATLTNAILPRQLQGQMVWNQATQRRGLRVENDQVSNDLSVNIEKVLVRDRTGGYWVADDLSATATKTLQAVDNASLIEILKQKGWGNPTMWWSDIPMGTYVFITDEQIEWDFMTDAKDVDPIALGLENNHNLVYGVLP